MFFEMGEKEKNSAIPEQFEKGRTEIYWTDVISERNVCYEW